MKSLRHAGLIAALTLLFWTGSGLTARADAASASHKPQLADTAKPTAKKEPPPVDLEAERRFMINEQIISFLFIAGWFVLWGLMIKGKHCTASPHGGSIGRGYHVGPSPGGEMNRLNPPGPR